VELAPPRSKVRGSKRVLVMDDEVAVRTLAANMLDFLGYRPEVAESGRVAVERFKRALETDRPFDVVMLDLTVPGGMGARETIDQLARIDPAVKAVLVSGYAQHALTTEDLGHRFGAVIAKPFTLQELNTTLRSVLSSSAYNVH
jgi:CheY-like chemotaxis protein